MRIEKRDIDAIRDAIYYLQTVCKTLDETDLQKSLVQIVSRLSKIHHLLQLTLIAPPLSLDILLHGELSNDHPYCKGVQLLVDAVIEDCHN